MCVPRADTALGVGEAHVWCVDLGARFGDVEGLARLLGPQELARAEGVRFRDDRLRFIVRRALLRIFLSRYVGCGAREIEFTVGLHGKPALVRVPSLAFNASSSGEVALYAVARGGRVGVDIERVTDSLDALNVARRFFTPREADLIEAVPGEFVSEAFLRCWTFKEAYAKAVGAGLHLPLDSFEVPFQGDGVHGNRGDDGADGDGRVPEGWVFRRLAVPAGYVGGFASDGKVPRIVRLEGVGGSGEGGRESA